MTKKKLLQISLVVLFCILVACSSVEESKLRQIDFEYLETLMNGENDGFVLIIKDLDEDFIPYVEQVANDKGVRISLYHTHQPDGEGTEEINRPDFEYSSKLKGSRLYYIEDGEITNELQVRNYEDTQLIAEVQNFIEVHQ